MNLYFDLEFTGLHQQTTPISLGIMDGNGKKFYAEFNDFKVDQVDDWIMENVICKLNYNDKLFALEKTRYNDVFMKGTKDTIVSELSKWLKQYDHVEMWSDCLAYDWVLFNDLFGGAFKIPSNVYYIPFDICTLFKIKGIDPDVNREKFCFGDKSGEYKHLKHSAIFDAEVIKLCYEKLMRM